MDVNLKHSQGCVTREACHSTPLHRGLLPAPLVTTLDDYGKGFIVILKHKMPKRSPCLMTRGPTPLFLQEETAHNTIATVSQALLCNAAVAALRDPLSLLVTRTEF